MIEKERKVVVITDAGADLQTRNIHQIPLAVSFGTKEYIIGENIDNNLFKKLVKETGEIPKTAALGPMVFLDKYEELGKDGLDILSINLGDNLSTTGNSARIAAEMYNPEKVTVYDSGTVSMAEGFMVMEAQKMAIAGATIQEIIKKLDYMKSRTTLLAIVPNIPYLRSSGRVSHVQGILAGILKITPILRIDNGVVESAAKVKEMKGAIDWTVNFIKEKKEVKRVAILDFDTEKAADDLKNRLIQESIPEEMIIRGELGPVTASHGGPGTVAVAIVG